MKFKPCYMIEDIQKITCREQHNDKQSLFVMLDSRLKNEQRLQCDKCLLTKRGEFNAITVEDAKSRIEKYLNRHLSELEKLIFDKITHLDEISKTLNNIQIQLEKQLQDVQDRINIWKKQLELFLNENCQFSLIKELVNLDKEENQWVLEKLSHSLNQINVIDHQHSIILKFRVDEIQRQVQKILSAEEQLYQNIQKENQNQFFQKPKEQKMHQKVLNSLVKEIKQNELCYAIGFNKNDSIMAAGFNHCIKIWKITNGQFIDQQIILQGKSEVDFAVCLIFSKRINLFIYGSYDHNIGIWNEISDNLWNQYNSTNIMSHQGLITCICLNQNEDYIISGSEDKSIIIWKINGTSIIFDEQLKKHTNTIVSINYNQTETEIASISKDQFIIIWEKIKQKWGLKQVIEYSNANFGQIITFLSDDKLILYQHFQRIIYTRDKVDKPFSYSQKQSLDLSKSVKQDKQFLFPTIYEIKNNLIVQKYNGNVYFLIVNQDFQLINFSKQKIVQNNTFYGKMTNNGKYLAIWNQGGFKIYSLTYD
ncbi:unnamed protein product (macronuclear) [Paramecium tetraurelia]|uniref:Uncharacterized protein n=1 Tax=Paramecium tetraurelia TaxID=5888 RepID=A0D829_PARTE|nr:uncharacterized protein GSPATT00014163001 [Paramecium tetraurelia]CAK79196.1 unnamed protein product [Paramecium tetraurelia]|eukprot:XP_001446593.1 hypothetical protein (macronuclear) [Paramecium tetraurelia strain d4-2]